MSTQLLTPLAGFSMYPISKAASVMGKLGKIGLLEILRFGEQFSWALCVPNVLDLILCCHPIIFFSFACKLEN